MNHADAIAAVERAMAEQGMTARDLATAAGVARNTIGFMLGGKSWPRRDTLARIERALDLPHGTLSADVARSDDSSVSGVSTGESFVIHFGPQEVDGLTTTDLDELQAAVRDTFLRRRREILASKGQD